MAISLDWLAYNWHTTLKRKHKAGKDMDITFERGSEDSPKGHAFVYFRSSTDPSDVWASYIVMLPITVDVAKYAPPFLMSLIPDGGMKDMSSFAFPPAPEQMRSIERFSSWQRCGTTMFCLRERSTRQTCRA